MLFVPLAAVGEAFAIGFSRSTAARAAGYAYERGARAIS
jgi:hypothetical protein